MSKEYRKTHGYKDRPRDRHCLTEHVRVHVGRDGKDGSNVRSAKREAGKTYPSVSSPRKRRGV